MAVVVMMMCEVFDGIVRCWERGSLRGGEGVRCCYMYNTMVCVYVCGSRAVGIGSWDCVDWVGGAGVLAVPGECW